MGSRIYPKLLALIKKWPVERITSEKPLGDHVKKTVLQSYQSYGGGGTIPSSEEAKLERFYESCYRLVNNTHKKQYERFFPDITSSGIESKIPPNTKVELSSLGQYTEDTEYRTITGKIKNSLPFAKGPTEQNLLKD